MISVLLPAWLCGIILSLVIAPLGAFVIWRKMAYVGDTLAHASLLGVAIGLFFYINSYISVILIIILLAIGLVFLESKTSFSMDTLLGIIAHSTLSLGVIAVSILENVRVDLLAYLFGDILSIDYQDILWISIGVLAISAILFYYWYDLISMTVHEELAAVEGVNTQKMKIVLMLSTALTIALSMKFVGVLIITSLLIIPVATARRFALTPEQMVIKGYLISCLSITLGLGFSAIYDTPAGPAVVAMATGLFLASLLKKNAI